MMRPMLTREEYMALRDSDVNRRADKMHMVQMNYSCLPCPNGALKGSTTLSSTVGMDIDFDPKDPAYEQKMQSVPDLILGKREELGLLMLERSATKGYHIAFRRHPELTQEENLKWASALLGVAYDKGAKDITRVFFTPADKLLFLDDGLFEIAGGGPSGQAGRNDDHGNGGGSDCAGGVVKADVVRADGVLAGSGMRADDMRADGVQADGVPAVEPTAVNKKAFDLCVKSAGLKLGAMDIWGEHNWHSNLMAVLSVGLPKLMSKEQLLAVVGEKLPNYSKTEDCRELIEYFYEKYSADKGFMSVSLRQINAEAQSSADPIDKEDGESGDADLDALNRGWEMPAAPKKIPRLLELLAGNYDPRFREMLLLSALPILSAHASHFRAVYLNGRTIGPQQYVAVIGGSGSGKGNCTALFNDMVKYTLQESDEREWEKVRQNAELRDKLANAKERPPKYHPKLRLFEATSKTSILDLQNNLGKNGMLLGQFSEVDGFSAATHAAYSNITVLLRKAWDMDIQRQYYMSDSSCNTYAQMSMSLLMAGTVKAMLERMFGDDNCEGGLMQRFIPVIVPKTRRTFRPPQQNFLSEEEKKERDALLIDLFQKDLSLGDNTLTLETPLTNRMIGQWFDELEERYNDGEMSEAEAELSHRCGEFMIRAAIPLIALYGKETKEIIDFCRWVGDVALSSLCRLFGYRVQKDINDSNEMMSRTLDARVTSEPLLSSLPEVFTIKDFKEARIKAGQSPEATMLLSRYCKKGKLQRIGRGVYRKTEPK